MYVCFEMHTQWINERDFEVLKVTHRYTKLFCVPVSYFSHFSKSSILLYLHAKQCEKMNLRAKQFIMYSSARQNHLYTLFGVQKSNQNYPITHA